MSEIISPSAVVECLEQAWVTEQYDDRLECELRQTCLHPEAEEAKRRFLGKKWQDVDESILLKNFPSPFLIGNAPFRYYLGAFLICAIRNRDSADLMEYLIEFELRLPKKTGPVERFRARFDPLTYSQKQAVACFLKYCIQHYSTFNKRAAKRMEYSLDNYWSTDCHPVN